jgi:hypothetical protein
MYSKHIVLIHMNLYQFTFILINSSKMHVRNKIILIYDNCGVRLCAVCGVRCAAL